MAVIGESELEKGAATVKNMATGEAEEVAFDSVAEYFTGK
ncbi:MAG: His/Gly/Thr/Pro-type tRNA ligase C-terminal domain-containing protein [Candidatus Scatosoma sp.]